MSFFLDIVLLNVSVATIRPKSNSGHNPKCPSFKQIFLLNAHNESGHNQAHNQTVATNLNVLLLDIVLFNAHNKRGHNQATIKQQPRCLMSFFLHKFFIQCPKRKWPQSRPQSILGYVWGAAQQQLVIVFSLNCIKYT